MNEQTRYSDEHINAYIDDELDSEERTRLVYDEQTETGLAERIASARMLKEKVQLAYAHIDEDFFDDRRETVDRNRLVTPMRAAAAVFILIVGALLVSTLVGPGEAELERARSLIASTDGVPSQQLVASVSGDNNIVIDLNRYDPGSFDATLGDLEALARATDARVEVVANGQGLSVLETSSGHAEQLAALADRLGNLDVMVCAASLAAARSGRSVDLLDNIVTTTSVIHQVARRTADGWTYLKLL